MEAPLLSQVLNDHNYTIETSNLLWRSSETEELLIIRFQNQKVVLNEALQQFSLRMFLIPKVAVPGSLPSIQHSCCIPVSKFKGDLTQLHGHWGTDVHASHQRIGLGH